MSEGKEKSRLAPSTRVDRIGEFCYHIKDKPRLHSIADRVSASPNLPEDFCLAG
jgi:hypothetical protein